MKTAEHVIAHAREHRDHEELICLAALSVLWLSPQEPEAKNLLLFCKERKHSTDGIREAALQLFLLAGFQTSLEAFFQIRDVYHESFPGDPRELEEIYSRVWLNRGYQLQANVYRDNVEKLRQNLREISPELESWTVMIGYGMVMSRAGLLPHVRELLEIAVLAVQGFPRQLHSHFRGALNLGATPDEIEITLKVVAPWLNEERSRSAWQLWRHVK